MRLFIKGEKVDVKKRIEMVGQAYGVKHPEKVHGFAGYFLRGEPDTYLSDGTEMYLDAHPEFETEVREAARRFSADDFGILPKDDVRAQLEGHLYVRLLPLAERDLRNVRRHSDVRTFL